MSVEHEEGADEERVAWIALAAVDGVGPIVFARLIGAFGTAGSVLGAARAGRLPRDLYRLEAKARGEPQRALPASLIAAIEVAAAEPRAAMARRSEPGDSVITWGDADYPARLRGSDEAPPVLFVRGDRAALSASHSIGIVGTRRPTPAGRSFAAASAAAIASCGAVVVSGLAFGIDAAAHAATVEAGGVTVAIIGSGLGVLTPVAHRRLADAIVEAGGAIVSEQRHRAMPTKGTYPRRNRLIAGLAEAVVVVEAPRRSGALNTAHWAATFGRDLYVVPGRPWESATAGCVALLHDVPGARPVVDVPTLLTDLGLVGEHASGSKGRLSLDAVLVGLSAVESALARALRRAPASADRLADQCGLRVDEAAVGLSLLELRGYAWSSGPLYMAGGPLRDAR